MKYSSFKGSLRIQLVNRRRGYILNYTDYISKVNVTFGMDELHQRNQFQKQRSREGKNEKKKRRVVDVNASSTLKILRSEAS
jgi:hypothetical protein